MGDRVVLAMSGGVDSSAAAVLLHEQGYEVVGLFMRSGESEASCSVKPAGLLPIAAPHRQGCCSAEDAADARRVADRMGIPFHALNFKDEFRRIKDYFADEYLAGRTPNPCVQCNNWLKFGKLWDFARQIDARFIATGHYAQTAVQPDGTWALLAGADSNKDQSYVLFGIQRALLPSILFPVGSSEKPEIRRLAREAGLRVADKKDSYEICFVPDQDHTGFLRSFRGPQETAGAFVDLQGHVLGHHDGYERFTIGQRKGLGLAFGEPRFVVRIDPQSKQVVLGRHADLAVTSIQIHQTNWLIDPPQSAFSCEVKVRYRQRSESCQVLPGNDGTACIEMQSPIFGVAPGQAAVFYDGRRVLGGGWIR